MIDVTDPTQPVGLGYYPVLVSADAVALDGERAYFLTDNWMQILDLSGTYPPPLLGYLQLSYLHGVSVQAPLVAIVASSYLRLYDVSNPAEPILRGLLYLLDNSRGVTLAGERAYVWTIEGLEIVDVADPSAPVRLGTFALDGIEEVQASGNYVYAATTTIGLAILDVSNPMAPTLAGQVSAIGTARAVRVQPPYAYVTGALHDLIVVDISVPTAPAIVGTYDSIWMSGRHLLLRDPYVFIASLSRVEAVDVRVPTAPTGAGSLDAPSMDDLAMMGNRIVLAGYDGLTVYQTNLSPAGDLNCDAVVDFGDINPFVLALTDPASYESYFPECSRYNGDLNFDGLFDFADINPFVALLSGP